MLGQKCELCADAGRHCSNEGLPRSSTQATTTSAEVPSDGPPANQPQSLPGSSSGEQNDQQRDEFLVTQASIPGAATTIFSPLQPNGPSATTNHEPGYGGGLHDYSTGAYQEFFPMSIHPGPQTAQYTGIPLSGMLDTGYLAAGGGVGPRVCPYDGNEAIFQKEQVDEDERAHEDDQSGEGHLSQKRSRARR